MSLTCKLWDHKRPRRFRWSRWQRDAVNGGQYRTQPCRRCGELLIERR